MPVAAERMSRVDTAWLRMDNDVNLMMIVGVWLLQPALDYEQLCTRVAEKLLRYDRFKQKVVQDAIGAQWVIPCHYEMFAFNTASPETFAVECRRLGQRHAVLHAGERWEFPIS